MIAALHPVAPAFSAAAPARPAVAGNVPVREGKPYLVFQAPDVREEDIAEVVACLRSRWIGTGPRARALEERFAEHVGVPHAVALASCTAALQLALLGLGVGPGDEVLTTDMTFCSTVSTILLAGATPVLCDVEPGTLCIDPAQVEARVTPRTRALVVVHMAGRPCDMDALLAVARRHGLWVIEDCAHAIETRWRGRPAGSMGDVGCFSFYSTKNVTSAEGGMLTTRDPALAQRVRRLSLHGMSSDAWNRFGPGGYHHYDVDEPGYKLNLPDMTAALALSQMARLDEIRRAREAVWRAYDAGLAGLPLTLPAPAAPHTRHARHLYAPLLDTSRVRIGRDDLLRALHAEGIGTGVHYRAISTLRYARERLGTRRGDFPVAQDAGDRTFSLPIATWMTPDDTADVVTAVRRVLAHYAV